jgi:hypothetical protein
MRFLPIIGLALLGGCYHEDTDAAPSESQVAMVEQRLANHPCVGDLNDWERYYRFAPATGLSAYTTSFDLDAIEFHLRRAGTFTIESGVKVLRRGETDDWPDGRNVHSLDGRFRIVGDKLSVSRCQPVRAG